MSRVLDICFAVFVLVCLSWLLVLVWCAVRLTSPGPGVFPQHRVGQRKHPFTCYKFRTMSQEAPQVGTHEISAHHVTPVGRFLRGTKLDELPQAVNILRGEMALVGPRPCLPEQTDVIAARAAKDVFAMRPGITGLAQIKGVDMSTPELLAETDAEYGQRRSVWLDLRIIFATALGRGFGDLIDDR